MEAWSTCPRPLPDAGITPAKFVERLRVETARRRLEESPDKLEKVAHDCGFGSVQALRRAFLRVLRTPPHEYRCQFQDTAAFSVCRDQPSV